MEEGKTVTFTATANDGYRVKSWTLDGKPITEAGTNTEYKLKVSKPATVTVSFELRPVEGGAVLILSPDKLTIEVRAVTEDGSDIAVEGCTETTLKSNALTELHAKGTKVVLKGKITMLDCSDNKLTSLNVQGLTALQGLSCSYNQLPELNVQGLTALRHLNCGGNKLSELNVQGCTALQKLGCYSNQLNAQAMTEILKALPSHTAGDDAMAVLYTEMTGETEGNCKDFSTPESLKTALDGAKKRNWKLQKMNASGDWVDI